MSLWFRDLWSKWHPKNKYTVIYFFDCELYFLWTMLKTTNRSIWSNDNVIYITLEERFFEGRFFYIFKCCLLHYHFIFSEFPSSFNAVSFLLLPFTKFFIYLPILFIIVFLIIFLNFASFLNYVGRGSYQFCFFLI